MTDSAPSPQPRRWRSAHRGPLGIRFDHELRLAKVPRKAAESWPRTEYRAAWSRQPVNPFARSALAAGPTSGKSRRLPRGPRKYSPLTTAKARYSARKGRHRRSRTGAATRGRFSDRPPSARQRTTGRGTAGRPRERPASSIRRRRARPPPAQRGDFRHQFRNRIAAGRGTAAGRWPQAGKAPPRWQCF